MNRSSRRHLWLRLREIIRESRDPSVGNMTDLVHLLRPRWLRARRRSSRERIVQIGFALIGIFLAAGLFAVSHWFLSICYQVELIGPLLVRRLLDVTLLALLGVLFLSNIIAAVGVFFSAHDLELLVTAPLPPRRLYVSRNFIQVFQSSWMVLAFGLPIIAAFAVVAGSWESVVAILITLPAALIIPSSLATVVVLCIVRFMPAGRLRSIVVALSFCSFLMLYVIIRVLEPERFLNPEGFASVVHFITSFSLPTHVLLPSHWMTTVIAATFTEGGPTPREAPWMLGALWSGALALHGIAATTFEWLYPDAYSRSQHSARIRPRVQRLPLRTLRRASARTLAGHFVAKDIQLLKRDASQWSQLLLLVALVFVYLYNFRHFRHIADAGLIGPTTLHLLGMTLAAFVTTAISVRFAYPLISMEGKMIWLLRTAPVLSADLLRAKWITVLVPLLVLSQLMAGISSLLLEAPAALVFISVVTSALIAFSVATLSIGLGAMFPDFEAESAAKVAASFGGLVTMIAALVVAFVYVALASYPVYIFATGRELNLVAMGGLVVGAGAVAGLSFWVSFQLGVRALERI